MRVNVVVPSFYPAAIYGGPIYSILAQCQALADLGVKVQVSTTNANGRTRLPLTANTPNELSPNLEVTYYNDTIIGRFSWRFLMSSWRSILSSDVVHIQDIFSTYIPPTLVVAIAARKPVLVSPRGVLTPWALTHKRRLAKRAWLALLFNPFIRRAWWHATSDQERKEILNLYPEARVVVIPNGLNLKQYVRGLPLPRRQYMRRFVGDDSEPRQIIVSLGRLHQIKGFDLLIHAFSLFLSAEPDARLLIAGGDDGEARKLNDLIATLRLGNRVHLLGPIDDVAKIDFLLGADAFALCSHSENFGNAYAEALAAGVPVVATWGTPWRDIEHHGCGRWVAPEPKAIASALSEVLRFNRSQVRERARTFSANFSNERIGAAFLDTYKSMVTETPL